MRISDWSSDVCSSDLAGLLVSSRGSGGGVRLARPAAAINVAEIIEAVEGPIALTACCDEGRHDCGFEGSCQIQQHLGVVNGAVRAALAGISMASLVRSEEHTSELQSLMRISYAVFCLKKKKNDCYIKLT